MYAGGMGLENFSLGNILITSTIYDRSTQEDGIIRLPCTRVQ